MLGAAWQVCPEAGASPSLTVPSGSWFSRDICPCGSSAASTSPHNTIACTQHTYTCITCAQSHTCAKYIRMYTRVRPCRGHVCTQSNTHRGNTHRHTVHTCIRIYTTYTHTYLNTHTHYTCAHTCTHTMHIHIRKHTHKRTHTGAGVGL